MFCQGVCVFLYGDKLYEKRLLYAFLSIRMLILAEMGVASGIKRTVEGYNVTPLCQSTSLWLALQNQVLLIKEKPLNLLLKRKLWKSPFSI